MPRKNFVGQRFGSLVVQKMLWPSDHPELKLSNTSVECLCDCGVLITRLMSCLTQDKSTHCGCQTGLKHRKSQVGKRYGRLLVISEYRKETKKHTIAMSECLCDCGNKFTVRASALTTGNTSSCGCLRSETARKTMQKEPGLATKNRVLKNYQSGAKRRGICFELTKEEFFAFLSQQCYYCNRLPYRCWESRCKDPARALVYNGLDRLDNSIGYTKENAVPCCYECNLLKLAWSADEFLAWIKKIYEYQQTK